MNAASKLREMIQEQEEQKRRREERLRRDRENSKRCLECGEWVPFLDEELMCCECNGERERLMKRASRRSPAEASDIRYNGGSD